MFSRNRTLSTLVILAGFAAIPLVASDAIAFNMSVGANHELVITGSNGGVSTISSLAVNQHVRVGSGTDFHVSYGSDASGQLTATLTPGASESDLHFTVAGKSVDADKAIVTLTFSRDLKSVEIDPGYVGTVDVDSHPLRTHLLSDDVPSPATPASSAPAAPASADTVTANPATAPVETSSSSSSALAAVPSLLASAPPMLASQLTSPLAPMPKEMTATQAPAATPPAPTPVASNPPVAGIAAAAPGPIKLYWSEPVTGPDGTAPQVAVDQIKLVEVHGEVAVVLPGGETQTGSEGMVVPSGSTVRTLDNASAALFVGGVDSARMIPQCELVVTQTFDASVRRVVIDLHRGAVFARVSHRDGETEDFQVHTPEGSANANGSEMMAFRGNLADLQSTRTTMRSGLVLDNRRLLAWNPTPLAHGLISDLPDANLGILTSIGSIPSTYFYFAGNQVTITAKQIRQEVLTNHTNASSPSESEPDAVLQNVLLVLQPYNTKLLKLLGAINAATETPAQLAFYKNLITVFFDQQAPSLINDLTNHPHGFARELSQDSAILYQDLRLFGTNLATPF